MAATLFLFRVIKEKYFGITRLETENIKIEKLAIIPITSILKILRLTKR